MYIVPYNKVTDPFPFAPSICHFVDLSLNGHEADSLITSNMAPMFPAFKGESVLQIFIGCCCF